MFFRYQRVVKYIQILKGALRKRCYGHTHACDCSAPMKLQNTSVMINSSDRIYSTRNKWVCSPPMVAPYLAMQESTMQNMCKHLSCPQMPEQPLRHRVAGVCGYINTPNREVCSFSTSPLPFSHTFRLSTSPNLLLRHVCIVAEFFNTECVPKTPLFSLFSRVNSINKTQ